MSEQSRWRLSDVLGANAEAVTVRLAWEFKLHLLERVAKILSDLHGKKLTYGTNLLSAHHVLIQDEKRFGLEGLESYPQETKLNQRSQDVLRWGVLAVQIYTDVNISQTTFPGLWELLEGEKPKVPSSASSDSLSAQTQGQPQTTQTEERPQEPRKSAASYVEMVRDAAVTIFTTVRRSFESTELAELEGAVEKELNTAIPLESSDEAGKPEWLLKLEELIYDAVLHHPRPEANALRTGLVNLIEDFNAQKASVNSPVAHEAFYLDFTMDDMVRHVKPSVEQIKMYDPGDTQGTAWDTDSHYSDDLTHFPEHAPKRLLQHEGNGGRAHGKSAGKGQDSSEAKGSGSAQKRQSVTVPLVTEEAQEQRKPSVPILGVEELETKFDEQARLDREQIISLLNKARVLLSQESNIIEVEAPVAVIGDLHGQYYDLRNLLDLVKQQTDPDGKVLFLGDYVDRGKWSCETFFYLLRLKLARPEHVHLLRGNHESDSTAAAYGFRNEVDRKYGRDVYHRCLEVFKALPLACILKVKEGKPFIAVHGGISENVRSLDNIKEIDRFVEPPVDGTFCDLLWSDPVSNDFLTQHKEIKVDFENIEYYDNPVRGCAQTFGYKALRRFLDENNLSGLIRAHEAKEEGYQFQFHELGSGEHVVATVFSAPNYMKTHGNKGAFLMVHSEAQATSASAKSGQCAVAHLEPFSFKEVPNPPVRNTGDETFSLLQDVEQYCPYMSRDVEDFYNYTLDMLDYFGKAEDDDEFAWIRDPWGKASSRGKRQDSVPSVQSGKISSTHSISAHSTFSMRSHRSLQSLSSLTSEATKLNNLKGTVKKGGKEKKTGTSGASAAAPSPHKRLQNMDEIHPLVLRQRLNNTSQELDSAYEKTQGKNTTGKGASSSAEPARDLRVGSVTFSPKERQVIQFVFFTIDRFDSGKVGHEEIQAWALEEGLVIEEEDAKLCVSAIDYDADGKIGISDFFIYASKLKETWQVEHKRLNQWKHVDDDNFSDFMSSDDDESY